MNIEEWEKINSFMESLKQLSSNLESWVIDNINLQYANAGQINIRLINPYWKKDLKSEIADKTQEHSKSKKEVSE